MRSRWENSWSSRAMKPQGAWIIPTVAWVGPGAWRGTINLQHDEPGSKGIDPAWPQEVGPEACLYYLLHSPLSPQTSPADCTSPKGSASHSCIPNTLHEKKKKKDCSFHLVRVLLTVSKWEQAVGGGGESGRKLGNFTGISSFSLSCHYPPIYPPNAFGIKT